MSNTLKILVIEDVVTDFLLLERHLRQHVLAVECQHVVMRYRVGSGIAK